MTQDKHSTVDLEEGTELRLDYQKTTKVAAQSLEVIPVAVQNIETKEIILIAYTNEQAFTRSIQTRVATFWSTSRNKLWVKGEGSGNSFELVQVRVNCEQNSLVYLVRAKGEGICHTRNVQGKARDCFYRRVNLENRRLENVDP